MIKSRGQCYKTFFPQMVRKVCCSDALTGTYLQNNPIFQEKINYKAGPWLWWSASSPSPTILVRILLTPTVFTVIFVFEKNKNKQNGAGVGPLKICSKTCCFTVWRNQDFLPKRFYNIDHSWAVAFLFENEPRTSRASGSIALLFWIVKPWSYVSIRSYWVGDTSLWTKRLGYVLPGPGPSPTFKEKLWLEMMLVLSILIGCSKAPQKVYKLHNYTHEKDLALYFP